MKRIFGVWVVCGMVMVTGCERASLEVEEAGPSAVETLESGQWKVHDMDRPAPGVVTPGADSSQAPSDAIVLFDGSDLSQWQPTKWVIRNGVMESVKGAGYIKTKENFGSCQLHVEFATPQNVQGNGQGRGNSGVFLQDEYEVQVLDSYENRTYSNGQAGAIYKQHIPMVNASRGPGEWQSYDAIFTAPRFGSDGAVLQPAYVTAFHNGVLILNRVELQGPMRYIGETAYEAHGEKLPLMLQDHGNPVSYRNIWLRELLTE